METPIKHVILPNQSDNAVWREAFNAAIVGLSQRDGNAALVVYRAKQIADEALKMYRGEWVCTPLGGPPRKHTAHSEPTPIQGGPSPLRPHSHAWIRTELVTERRTGVPRGPEPGDSVVANSGPQGPWGTIVGVTLLTKGAVECEVIFDGVAPPLGATIRFCKEYGEVMPTAVVVSYVPRVDLEPEAVKTRHDMADQLAALRKETDALQTRMANPPNVVVSVVSTKTAINPSTEPT